MNSQCHECGTAMGPQVLPQYPRFRKKAGVIIFEDVPCLECPNSGERVFTDEVAARMEEILLGQRAPTGKVEAPSYSLEGSAARAGR